MSQRAGVVNGYTTGAPRGPGLRTFRRGFRAPMVQAASTPVLEGWMAPLAVSFRSLDSPGLIESLPCGRDREQSYRIDPAVSPSS